LAGETLVTLENGLKMPIRALEGRSNFNIWALNPNTHQLEVTSVSRAFCTGRKPLFKMRTLIGREIRATGNHQFLTSEGWKRLDQLTIGEYLALPRVLPLQQAHQRNPKAEAALPVSSHHHTRPFDSAAHAAASTEPVTLVESDVYWDRIVSVEADGEEQVYDLTVPVYHNFIANDIIVHNSLEQDADIVMFIYRPDQYEKDTVKQNVAEIIVAKHRNGPVGSVELVFRGALAKFENAATRVFKPNE
jgi:replicative DNA helicase